ncbi:prophage tail fiber N-terminal domain-containing protein [Yersinia ruckeri]|uniref:phage tail fiber protein n=1 Tax=Yersinia ruckeri TaxID=29486 RepID=UPI0020BED25F|nr:prophage tail fiber N-terminal domain-containing protein [Yersinia ruckeri]
MSILVSGVLMDPLGRPIPAAQITLTAIANSLSVLNGLSATVETDSVGRYGITLAMGSYAISIAAEGRNHVYGAITLDETTGPSTLNQLLKQQMMESEVTPDVILYFRQIQQQVANDLSTMTVMESHVTGAASSAAESEAAAKGYAANLANAVATARHYRDQAADSANTANEGASSATVSQQAAADSQQKAAISEDNTREYRDSAQQAAATAADRAATLAAEQTADKIKVQVKVDADRAELARTTSEQMKVSIDTTAQQVIQQHGEAVQAASNAKASETQAANSAGTATTVAETAVTAKDQAAASAQSASHSAGGCRGSAKQAAGSAVAAARSAVTAKNEADRATAATDGKLDKTGGRLTGTLNSNVASAYGNVHFTGATGHSFASWRSRYANIIIDCQNPYHAYTLIRWTEQNVRHLAAIHCHAGGKTPSLTRISFSVYDQMDNHRFFNNRYEVGTGGTVYENGDLSGKVWGGYLSDFINKHCMIKYQSTIVHADTPFRGFNSSGVYRFNEKLGGFPISTHYGNLLNLQGCRDTWFQLVNSNYLTGDLWIRSGNVAGSQSRWLKFYSTGNTAVDANGFIRAASPIIRLFDNTQFDDVAYYSVPEGFTPAGAAAVNSAAKGVTAERISEGVYQVTGAKGFAIEGWQIELPTDDNRQPLVWAEREVDETGVLTIRTYHREHPNSPPFAQNKKDGYRDGQPVDIPHGRWVDVRLDE